MTIAEELYAAAFQLRNPHHGSGLKLGIDADLAVLLADWLDHHADQRLRIEAIMDRLPDGADRHPLAVARAINRSQS